MTENRAWACIHRCSRGCCHSGNCQEGRLNIKSWIHRDKSPWFYVWVSVVSTQKIKFRPREKKKRYVWKGWASLRARVSEKRQRQILAQNLALASQSQPVLSADREYKEPWKNWFHCNCSMRPGRLKHKAGAASSCLPSSPGLPTGPHVWIKALAMLSVLWEERFRKGKGGKEGHAFGMFSNCWFRVLLSSYSVKTCDLQRSWA